MVPVPGGKFTMGAGDDERADSEEFPRHEVTLSPYSIGKYEVTNGQYCEVLNWALAREYLAGATGGPYNGGNVFLNGKRLMKIVSSRCHIVYSGGAFGWKTRDGYSMESHPAVEVSWYGAVAFCNWLSEKEGRTVAYDLSTWELVQEWLSVNGYRLPTEAEWEQAAGWDGKRHWKYGFAGDDINPSRSNCYDGGWVNPLGLSIQPFTSPVGWFDGENISPIGSVRTVDSHSPVGAYDMSGGVWEWCQDWIGSYGSEPQTNPTGPPTGSDRVLRGGSWSAEARRCRSAYRHSMKPGIQYRHVGFRVAASQQTTAK